jgi:hypothetical protein
MVIIGHFLIFWLYPPCIATEIRGKVFSWYFLSPFPQRSLLPRSRQYPNFSASLPCFDPFPVFPLVPRGAELERLAGGGGEGVRSDSALNGRILSLLASLPSIMLQSSDDGTDFEFVTQNDEIIDGKIVGISGHISRTLE